MKSAARVALHAGHQLSLAPYAFTTTLPLGETNLEVSLQVEDPALADCIGARLAAHASVAVRPRTATVAVTLLSRAATSYGLAVEPGVRRAINTRVPEVIAFECTTMMEADLAMRSAMAISLPERFEGLHGGLLRIGSRLDGRTRTVALLGASGAGKSHIIAQFLEDPGCEVDVLAEDWFVACAETGRAYFLRERRILLKHATVALYAGSGPPPQPSHIDPADGARALYDIDRLFVAGSDDGGQAVIDTLVVLQAESSTGPEVRRLTAEDAQWIRTGEYSAYYQANEQLLDGSTEVFTAAQIDRRLTNIRRLAERTSSFVFAGSHALNGHTALRRLLFPGSVPDDVRARPDQVS